ncbi:MAG: hypothetical protein V2I24_04490 [Halieaceae bacterium]|jgi:hypothetical protein|nr:hypothetical protein [Halieaceae bacterium]
MKQRDSDSPNAGSATGDSISRSTDSDRRRLLKASAAAPLIATLAPNAATAMTSVSCEQKTVFSRDNDGAFDPATDTAADPKNAGGFVRRMAERYDPLPNNSSGETRTVYRVPGEGLWTADGVQVYLTSKGGDINKNDYPTSGQTVWVVRYYSVNMTGDDASPTGFFPQKQAYNQPLSGSCLMSIDPKEAAHI